MEKPKEIKELTKEFEACQKILVALGDEVRQHLILQILKDAGIMKMRRESTKNYYYFDAVDSMDKLITTLEHAKKIMEQLPDRSGEDEW